MRREPRGAQTCMFALRTDVAALGRRCCQKCFGTTGPRARSALGGPPVPQGRACPPGRVTSGLARCACWHKEKAADEAVSSIGGIDPDYDIPVGECRRNRTCAAEPADVSQAQKRSVATTESQRKG